MSNTELISAIKNYSGDNFYLNLIKNNLSFTDSQLTMARKLLETHAIESNDKGFFAKPIQVLELNWSKYSHKQPFDFQKEGISWLLGKKHAILGDEQGLGKSLQAILASLESSYKKILIVCPATLKLNWKREIEVFSPDVEVINTGDYKIGKRFTIINYDLLKKYFDKLSKEKFELLIADECFPYDTKVQTLNGEMCIGDIVERQLDVPILSYNFETKQTEFKKINRYIKKESNTLLRIQLLNELFIECTPNHKIYVNERGYVRADEIRPGDELYYLQQSVKENSKKILLKNLYVNSSEVLQKMSSTVEKKQLRLLSSLLFSPMLNTIYKGKQQKQDKGIVSSMFQGIRGFKKLNKAFLFDKVFSSVAVFKTRAQRNYEECNFSGASFENFKKDAPRQSACSKRGFRTYEEEQSHVQPGNLGENEKLIERENVCFEGRKWKILQTTRSCFKNTRRWLGSRVSNSNQRSNWCLAVTPNMLQTGYCEPFFEASNRNRWSNSQTKEVEVSRSEKNNDIKRIRVESVEVFESGSRYRFGEGSSNNKTGGDTTTVYNIEVSDNNNYFANNVLVSNCHLAKNSTAIRSKNLKKISTKTKATWLLTGTPIANKPIDFYFLLKMCKHELGSNKDQFGKRYCGAVNNGFGWVYNGASNLKELHYKTQDVLLRRTKDQVLDLPDKVQVPIFLELDSKERKEYDNCIENYYEEIERLANDPSSELFGMTFNANSSYLGELSIYRQYTALKKVLDGATPELIDASLEEGKKVIIFTNYRKVIDSLEPLYRGNCVVLDGRKTLEERQQAIDLFQASPKNSPQVIICNYQVASVGVTLTQAQTMIMNDLPWSPAALQQAQDRAHRIGQKNNLNIYYPIYEETIDAVMFNVLKTKLQHVSEILTGDGDISDMFIQENIALEIYNQIKNNKK